ncbi:MAG: hypothetical protein OJF50_004020 [Nitrospira sp.]|jgi:hypothetical protein|nr:hypothetical protein [Nitrospira sp.]
MEIFAETEAISAGIPPSTVEEKNFSSGRLTVGFRVMVWCSCFWDQHKVSKKTVLMRSKTRLSRLTGMMSVLCLITGCASEFSVFSASGEPLLISRRGYTPGECTGMVKEDAARMGVTLRYVHIRGNTVGRSLLWPFEPGYACEAAIGPPDGPIGIYPGSPHVIIRGS